MDQKYDEIRKSLNSLLDNNKDEEQVKKIGEVLAQVQDAEQEKAELKEKYENLVLDYGQMVKHTSSAIPPKDEDNETKPLTLEEIVKNISSK